MTGSGAAGNRLRLGVSGWAPGGRPLGNLSSQQDVLRSQTETFTYDSLNRLTQSAIVGGATKTVTYDAIGNTLQFR